MRTYTWILVSLVTAALAEQQHVLNSHHHSDCDHADEDHMRNAHGIYRTPSEE